MNSDNVATLFRKLDSKRRQEISLRRNLTVPSSIPFSNGENNLIESLGNGCSSSVNMNYQKLENKH